MHLLLLEGKIMRYEDAAEEVTVTLSGWKCKTCGNFFQKNKQIQDPEHNARYCCASDFPCECGGRYEKPYSFCMECREKSYLRIEKEIFDNAELVEYDGPFFVDDNFYNDIDEYLQSCEDEDIKPEAYAFVPKKFPCQLDFKDITSHAFEDIAESQIVGMDDLKKSIEEFNLKNKHLFSYIYSTKQKFQINV